MTNHVMSTLHHIQFMTWMCNWSFSN